MKTHVQNLFLLLALLASINQVSAEDTAFSYQGRLNNGTNAASGFYDFRFALSNAPSGGAQIGSTITNLAVGVTNGLFTTLLDFGAVFTGNATWLGISVRTNGPGSFSPLSPLQEITPAPYAVMADSASNLLGALPAAQLSGTIANGNLPASPTFSGAVTGGSFSGSGASLTALNANNLASGTVPLARLSGITSNQLDAATWKLATNGASGGVVTATNAWQLNGNNVSAGQFIGSMNNQPVELWVNNGRALRLEPDVGQYDAPNVIGGASVNFVASGVYGATIGGGGASTYSQANSVTNVWGTVAGGTENTSGGYGATVGGGYQNTASGSAATVPGGVGNVASGATSFIGGGNGNTASQEGATVAGGWGNIASGIGSFIGGGGFDGNNFGRNTVQASAATIGGGLGNNITSAATYATIGGGQANNASGIGSFIGGGGYDGFTEAGNTNQASAGTIGGGLENTITSAAMYATIGGGLYNTASGYGATVAGGGANTASGTESFAAGGENNAIGNYSFAAGYAANASGNNSFAWSDGSAATSAGNNQFVVRASGGVSFYSGVINLNPGGVTLNSGPVTWYSGPVTWYTPASDFFIHCGNFYIYSQFGTFSLGSGGWVNSCDRNAKKNFQPVDTVAVLDKLAAIPIQRWNYKWEEDTAVPNIGPMAQDFIHAFYPGRDDKGISTLQFDGVELAAIQGLNQKLEQQSKAKDEEIQDLKARLEKLERLINTKGGESK